MTDDAIFLSIKPKYAEQILAGTKTVELRRVRPRIGAGALVVMYASSPTRAVCGAFEVDRVVTRSPAELWPLVEHQAGVTREEFDAYYRGAEHGVAIFVRAAFGADEPYGLDEIRRDVPAFHPPQAFRYLHGLGGHAQALLDRICLDSPLPSTSPA